MKSYLKTMNQALHKRLSMPLLITVISAIGIGVSTPARSATLASSQSTLIAEKPENLNIQRNYGKPLCNAPWVIPPHCVWEEPSRAPSEVELQQRQQQQRELQQQQRELQQQQRELQQQQRELQQQPNAEPSPQN